MSDLSPNIGPAGALAAHVSMRRGPRPSAGALVLGLVVCALSVELFWRIKFHIPSPARGVLFAVAAMAWGQGILAAIRRSRRVGAPVEAFIVGSVALTLSFALCGRFSLTKFFPLVAWSGALGAIGVLRPVRWMQRKVHWSSGLWGSVLLCLVIRLVYFVDRLDLSVARPAGFAWIDTPLWLSIAYGVERGCPPPDLLFAGERMNYHFGSGLLIAAVKATTGMSMHASYFCSMVMSVLALCVLLSRASRVFLRTNALASTAAGFVGIAAVPYFAANFASIVSTPVFLYLLIQLVRSRRVPEIVITVLGLLFLMITKEVHYVFFLVLGGCTAALSFWKHRRLVPMAAVVLSLIFTRPAYERLIRIDQKALLRPFTEHFSAGWLEELVRRESHWLLIAAFALLMAWSFRSCRRHFWFVACTFVAYAVGLALTAFIKPQFSPPMDPFSYEWILRDMYQFEMHGRLLFVGSLVLSALALISQPWMPRVRRARLAFVVTAALALYGVFNFWKCSPQSPRASRPEERGDDPVVALLAKVDPSNSVVAADRINWNDENPHWAAFYGHQFYVLRRGRWTTAYKSYAARLAAQEELFSTSDAQRAREIITRDGITHIVESRERPVPWLSGTEPIASNDAYAVYDVVRSP